MNNSANRLIRYARIIVCVALLLGAFVSHADSLDWKKNRVNASIDDWNLNTLLEKIATATGWQVYVEPGTSTTISVKFKNQTADEALRRMLKNVNYTRKETNGISQLYVYRTDAHAATQLVKAKKSDAPKKSARIPNELIVQLKRGSKMSIEELAAKLHAKIVGRNDRLNVYRLAFDDEASANAARQLLAGNSDIGAVDSNYTVDRPSPNQLVATASGINLNPKVMPEGKGFIGLIDTAVQQQSGFSPFLLPGESVAGQANLPSDSPTHGTGMFETMVDWMKDHPGKVMNFDVYGPNETTTTFEVANGVFDAINAGANPISMSLGGAGDSDYLHQIIKDAAAKGVVFVAAAGNEPGQANTFPAAWPEVIAVTAGNANGQIDSYANSGKFVDLVAPGTSYITVNGQMWMIEGTSVSTAVVSAMIAYDMNKYGINAVAAEQRLFASPPMGLTTRRTR